MLFKRYNRQAISSQIDSRKSGATPHRRLATERSEET
jgi:hypothetical protein